MFGWRLPLRTVSQTFTGGGVWREEPNQFFAFFLFPNNQLILAAAVVEH